MSKKVNPVAKKGQRRKTGKHAGGRPTKYRKVFCEQLIEFFDVEPYEDVEIPHYEKGEVKWTDSKRVANKMPTLRDFGKKIGADYMSIWRWTQKHAEFRNAYTRAQELRKEFLIHNGLNRCYDPSAFKFVAVNLTDMRDRKEQEITGDITVIVKKH